MKIVEVLLNYMLKVVLFIYVRIISRCGEVAISTGSLPVEPPFESEHRNIKSISSSRFSYSSSRDSQSIRAVIVRLVVQIHSDGKLDKWLSGRKHFPAKEATGQLVRRFKFFFIRNVLRDKQRPAKMLIG